MDRERVYYCRRLPCDRIATADRGEAESLFGLCVSAMVQAGAMGDEQGAETCEIKVECRLPPIHHGCCTISPYRAPGDSYLYLSEPSAVVRAPSPPPKEAESGIACRMTFVSPSEHQHPQSSRPAYYFTALSHTHR